MIRAFSLLLCLAPAVLGTVYLPGVVPSAFRDEERVSLKANKVTSTRTQVPYDYYDLPFCKSSKRRASKADNVGGQLSGDTATNSPYEVI
jgi:transmembrane 9 superfamily protein 2/4